MLCKCGLSVACAASVSVALFFSAPSAVAADEWSYWDQPVVAVGEPRFSGFYIGVHGGGAFTGASGVYDTGTGPGPYDLSGLDFDGATFGGHIGYNYLIGAFLIGIEADASALTGDTDGLKGATWLPGDYVLGAEAEHLWSVRGRLGLTFGNLLVFGTAGWGEAEFTLKATPWTFFGEPGGKLTLSNDGAVFGGGLEYACGNVLFRLEYLRYDVGFESSLIGLNVDADPPDFIKVDDIDVVRGAVSFMLY